MTYRYDPELAAAVSLLPDMSLTDIPALRVKIDELVDELVEVDESGVAFEDRDLDRPDGRPSVRVRIYRPESGHEVTAGILHLHAGGFVSGHLELEHAANLDLVRALDVIVVSVDYRLAPEHPYPAALEDCYTALEWMSGNGASLGLDVDAIALCGQSAGAGLCAGLALMARDQGGPTACFQYLASPELDDRLETPSMRRFVDTPVWNAPNAKLSWAAYLGELAAGGSDVPVYAAPARAGDLTGLPPAYVSVAEFDPLRDEGIAYAQALLAAGVRTELHAFPGTFHGAGVFVQAPVSRREAGERIEVLAHALGIQVNPEWQVAYRPG